MPSDNSFSAMVFNAAREDLLPPSVELITTNPMSAFMSQITLSILLSFLATAPFFIYRIIKYLYPALHSHEKRAVLLSLLPLLFLFFSGSAFSYFFPIPTTFKTLYPYAENIGAAQFFSIDEFVYYVFGLMVAVGMMFLLPIFMVLLSFTKIIKADFWKKRWKYAFLFFLIASAIITPDGTGMTMVMLFVPLIVLYFIGYIFARKADGRFNLKVAD